MAKPKKTKKQQQAQSSNLISIDPSRIRYQHSRIRPHFSGCGTSVHHTLESIQSGSLSVDDLPPIQVLIGPSDTDGNPWYFTLNNRRLWVFKQLREGGYLTTRVPENTVNVRVREVKSQSERERYTLENCSLDAKFIREKVVKEEHVNVGGVLDSGRSCQEEVEKSECVDEKVEEGCLAECSLEDSSEDESEDEVMHLNPFSALM
ncbi:hypothetical protein ACHAXN_011854 [Cyclotella atomus]